MKRERKRIGRPRCAPPHTGAAWRSALLTLLLLVGITVLGSLISAYHLVGAHSTQGIHIVPVAAPPATTRTLPAHQAPTEQSAPEISYTAPLLQPEIAEMPDICTTPEEPLAQLPLIDIPESLNAQSEAPRRATPTQPSAKRALATTPAKPTTPAVAASAPPAAITPPAYKKAPPPPYPAEMKASRTRGIVKVRIAVNPAGTPTQVHITTSSGHRIFDTTAVHWILQHWRFTPATQGGIPVASSISTRVEFILDNA